MFEPPLALSHLLTRNFVETKNEGDHLIARWDASSTTDSWSTWQRYASSMLGTRPNIVNRTSKDHDTLN